MTTPIIVLEIPHHGDPEAWVAWDGEEEVIGKAHDFIFESDDHRYDIFNMDDLKKIYGVADIPADALEIVKKDGHVGDLDNEGFVPVKDMPSEFDWAIDALFSDLKSGRVYRSRAELQDDLEYFPRVHQFERAEAELRYADELVGDWWDD
jgi:hypothetical protein